ncbi:MAG: nucleoside-diphosphate kinase, partial [Dehalococcoidia bacterium]|nr:nucleoside-diphosphate kinase [Dehalococcoidia bacterium]
QAQPGTIRGDFGLYIQNNLIHGSDSPEAARREIAVFFDKSDILAWERANDRWIFE